ncbi:MAG TPA: hypothetical protein VHA12_01745 [Candidatus Nanoarchaeia archaeon]|nr:hypothetical protein [Candidatus Nanoarchaeia archaeon]
MEKGRFLALLFFVTLLATQFTSAAITLTETKSVYSIGDELNLNATLQIAQGGNGFFTATLKCDNRDVELLRIPYSTKPSQVSSFSINAMLDRSLIGSLEGSCLVETTYGDEHVLTPRFEISSKIIVSADVQGNMFDPEDDIAVSGTAFLVNGQAVNGVWVFELVNTNLSESGTVNSGKFSGKITLPKSIASGVYNLRVIISQRDEYGNTLNTGVSEEQIKIKQVVQSAEVALSNVTVAPGSELSYQLVLYDQVLAKTTQDATVRLISPSGIVVSEKLINSAATHNSFSIGKDYSPGIWTVQVQVASITTNKSFGISELKSISVQRENSTLVIRNNGNVRYTDNLEIIVGETTQNIALNLGVGEEKRMKIFAPNGEYALSAKSGDQKSELGSTFLTGNAIAIKDISEVQVARIKLWFWIILVVVALIYTYSKYRKFKSNRVFTSPSSTPMVINMKSRNMGSKKEDDNFIWKSTSMPQTRKLSDLQQSRALMKTDDFGRKEETSILALKIKNNDELTKYKGSEPAMAAIVNATGIARSAKAKVTREENFTIMTFSKTSTGSNNPHLQAARVGKEMEALFKSHNRKYARKISFGLGLATGDMIVEKQGSSIQHTSVSNVVPLAKKIASHAHDALLLDNSTHGKLRGLVKSDKGIGGMYWSINSFVDRENHNEFIKKFMERRADESKSF